MRCLKLVLESVLSATEEPSGSELTASDRIFVFGLFVNDGAGFDGPSAELCFAFGEGSFGTRLDTQKCNHPSA
jgi:hypothetical protein